MTPVLPRELVDMMASRPHRLHHWLWHEVRNSWLSYPEDLQKQVSDMGWEPPRPALDQRRRPILDNDSGEDFLYMHRRMLIEVSKLLTRVADPNYPRVLVWTELPAPGDAEFPVPPAWFDPTGNDEIDRRTSFENLSRFKSDIFYRKRLVPWQKMFRDPVFLRDISLGYLGALIEGTIHASMHLRWASAPAGLRPEPGPREGHAIGTIWDDSRYDFLGDTYASHVNPVFWSLHGWVDDRVEDWKVANGVYGSDFWKGTWVGRWPGEEASTPESQPPVTGGPMPGDEPPTPAPATIHHVAETPVHDHPPIEEMEEMVRIIGECGVFYEGYARVLPNLG